MLTVSSYDFQFQYLVARGTMARAKGTLSAVLRVSTGQTDCHAVAHDNSQSVLRGGFHSFVSFNTRSNSQRRTTVRRACVVQNFPAVQVVYPQG